MRPRSSALNLPRRCVGYVLSYVPGFLTANPNDVARYELLPSFANRMLQFRDEGGQRHRHEDGEDTLERTRVQGEDHPCCRPGRDDR